MKRSLFYVTAVSFVLFCLLTTIGLAASVKELLDEQTKTVNGGIPYGACFLIAGLSVSAVAAYSIYLYARGWDTIKFLRAVKLGVSVAGSAAVLCTIWFMVWPGYMNAVGIAGLAASLATWAWVIAVVNQSLRSLQAREHV